MGNKLYCVFRLDDYVFRSDREIIVDILRTIRDHRVPHTIGLIPQTLVDQQDLPEFDSLRKCIDQGWIEPSLHGLDHQDRGIPNGQSTEFSGLPLELQAAKLHAGKAILEDIFQQDICTFIPPFNTYDANTEAACVANGLTVLSASLAGEINEPGLSFIPQTTNLQQFARAIRYGAGRAQLPPETLQVITYHPFEFRDRGPSRHKCSITMLSNVLDWVNRTSWIEAVTLRQAAQVLAGSLSQQRFEAAQVCRGNTFSASSPVRERICMTGCPDPHSLLPTEYYDRWLELVAWRKRTWPWWLLSPAGLGILSSLLLRRVTSRFHRSRDRAAGLSAPGRA